MTKKKKLKIMKNWKKLKIAKTWKELYENSETQEKKMRKN